MILNRWKKSAGLSPITAVILIGTAFYGAPWPAQTEAQGPRTSAPSVAKENPSVPEFSALQAYDRLSLNHALADEHLGKRTRVNGYMSTIRRKVESETSKYVLHIAVEREGATQELPELHFEFRQEDRKALAALVPGRRVTVEGTYARTKSEELYFNESKLIRIDDASAENLGRQQQLNAPRASRGGATLNEKVRHLQSRLIQQYPDGSSAEFRQAFLHGLKPSTVSWKNSQRTKSRMAERGAEYERVFQQQLDAQGRNDK